jgi:sulfide dehydrogenase cytochrome subunit
MADDFARQEPRFYNQQVDLAKAEKGDLLRKKYCDRCHENDDHDSDDDAPVIAGQWLKYLQLQISDYLSGTRPMSDKMAKKFRKLSAEDLDAIANFYASEKQGIRQ